MTSATPKVLTFISAFNDGPKHGFPEWEEYRLIIFWTFFCPAVSAFSSQYTQEFEMVFCSICYQYVFHSGIGCHFWLLVL